MLRTRPGGANGWPMIPEVFSFPKCGFAKLKDQSFDMLRDQTDLVEAGVLK
jgi:hypothetical protein